MDTNLSKEFWKDMAGIMAYCMENDTQNCELEVEVNGKILVVELNFKIK